MVDVDGKENEGGNGDDKKKKNRLRMRWGIIGAMITVLVAVSLNPWRNSLNLSLLHKSYLCSEVISRSLHMHACIDVSI